MIVIDLDGRIRWWNRAAEQIFGVPASAAIGQPMSMLFTRDDAAAKLPEHEMTVAAADAIADDDRWLVRADGSRFWASGVMTALHDAAGHLVGYGKVLQNRTDLREQVDTLRNRLEAVADANRRKDVFLSTLSHELRNPLAPLAHAADLIRLTVPATPKLEPILQIIERQVASLRRLVDDLLDLSRVGAGKIDIQKTTLVIQDIIQRAVETTRPVVRERAHTIDVLLPPGPIHIEGDRDRLEQVFVNLIGNAAKYTPENGHIWIAASTEGDEVVIDVQDDGVGIPADMLPRIFDLFTQVESSRNHAQGGLGIGLSLVKSLVTLHGGSVQVRSDGQGRGSRFIVRLPL
jgi:PAS domain S-box-containing protein